MTMAVYPFPPANRCIYCPKTENLSREHIIPESLGGKLVLEKASCPDCAVITGQFEQLVARDMYWPLRLNLGIMGKRSRKKGRRTHWVIQREDENGKIESIRVEVGKLPRIYVVVEMPPAGIILGEPPRDTNPELRVLLKCDREHLKKFGEALGATDWRSQHHWDWVAFNQLLAKVGHAYMTALLGFGGYEPLLIPIILGKSAFFPYLIGGVSNASENVVAPHGLDLLARVIRGEPYLCVRMTFFQGRFPTYEVVSAKITDLDLIKARNALGRRPVEFMIERG